MPRHRSLSLATFVSSISPELFHQYFLQLKIEQPPTGWELINAEALQNFLDDSKNAAASAIIREDFRRINDLCGKGMSLVTRAYNYNGIFLSPDKSALELAMSLYLDHREVFDYAWSRYLLLYGSTSKLTFHHVKARDLKVQPENVEELKIDLSGWFAGLAKGDVCHVQYFEDHGQHIFLISRGSYLRTVAHWQGDQVAFTSFRPASEDVLMFDPSDCELTIKASLSKDRQHYLEAFSAIIAKNGNLADEAISTPLFSLAPLQNGSFNFIGNDEITAVTLVRIRMKLNRKHTPTFELRSDDIIDTLRSEFNLGINDGEIAAVDLRFNIKCDGERPAQVTVEVEPPSRTDLAQKRYTDIIERYLFEQKVKLF